MSSSAMRPGPDGFTLIEALFAMMISAVVLTALAPALVHVAQQQRGFQVRAETDGLLLAEANRYTAMPFDELPAGDQCVTVDSGTFPHTRCVTVVTSGTGRRTLTVVVTPLYAGVEPDTVVVQRRRPTTKPFRQNGP